MQLINNVKLGKKSLPPMVNSENSTEGAHLLGPKQELPRVILGFLPHPRDGVEARSQLRLI